MARHAILLAFALMLLMPTSATAAECHFILGFKSLRDIIGHDIVGECLENEHYGENGDSLQQTTGGLLVWRKADNWTAFTDGYRTWIYGPNGLEQRFNNEYLPWEAENAIAALPWVSDGLTQFFEDLSASRLHSIANESPQVFWELMQKPWMQSESIHVERVWLTRLFEGMENMVKGDKETALRVVRMPFMDTLGFGSEWTWITLSDILEHDPQGLQQLLAHPVLSNGISEDHIASVPLLYLESIEPESAAAIGATPWRLEEPWAVEESRRLALASQPAFWAWMELFADDLGDRHILEGVSFIARIDKEAALQLIQMPYLRTKYKGDDGSMTFELSSVAWRSPEGLRQILSHPELQRGITDDDRGTVALLTLEWIDPEAAKTLRSLPWIDDGIDAAEAPAFFAAQELARGSRPGFQALAAKPWVQDHLTPEEQALVRDIKEILVRTSEGFSQETALGIIAMPFLESFEPFDAGAVASLSMLHRLDTGSRLAEILSHPTLRDGIRDDQTAHVAALGVATRLSPELLDAVLDPNQVIVKERTISFPEYGDVALGVVTISHEASENIDWLEFSVRAQVDFMGVAYPWGYVSLWVDDKAAEGAAGGAHETGHLHSGYYKAPGIVAHEAAHLYWRFGTNWITEGGAQLMDTMTENMRVGSPIHAIYEGKCAEAETIQQLEMIREERWQRGDFGYIGSCDHALGAGIFVDLYRTLGEGWFREGFRKLYHKMRAEEHEDVCQGRERNICYVRVAFVNEAHSQAAAAADRIINRWYYGSEHGLQ